ncbi:MAG: M48 family metallopeptidase [Pseudomonadales bacterium]|nr:M48 family metallopeptidase [Candidatus Woesebacteria bacterium]MCB9802106.1 M48 family metallopeptidase [Pseudomonadales bacterium]
MQNHYNLISENKTRSWIIMGVFVLFITLSTYAMSVAFGYGLDTVGVALIFSGLTSFASYWFSDKIILSMSGAREAKRDEYFDFYTTVENLCIGQSIPMPKLYVIQDSAMNAFATGRDPDHAVVCATTGLLSRLDRSEIEGVVAHELAHVQNYDIRLLSIVTVLVGFIALLADWMLRMSFFGNNKQSDDNRAPAQFQVFFIVVGIALAFLAPIVANLIKLAVSRRREFLADATGVSMTKNPEGLIRALEKISRDHEPLEAANKATAHLYIADPLRFRSDAVGWFAGLFQTHPPVEERIAALRGHTAA